MMKLRLVNSSGGDLGTIEATSNEGAWRKVAEEWLEHLTAGDKIEVVFGDEDDEGHGAVTDPDE